MGFFSWTCAKTGLPILNNTSWGSRPDAFEVVVLDKDGVVVRGEYGGYGSIGGYDLSDRVGDIENGTLKLVLRKFYTPADRLADLGLSRDEPGQGHFWDEGDIETLYAFGGIGSHRLLRAVQGKVLPALLAVAKPAAADALLTAAAQARKQAEQARLDEVRAITPLLDHEHDRDFTLMVESPRFAIRLDDEGSGILVGVQLPVEVPFPVDGFDEEAAAQHERDLQAAHEANLARHPGSVRADDGSALKPLANVTACGTLSIIRTEGTGDTVVDDKGVREERVQDLAAILAMHMTTGALRHTGTVNLMEPGGDEVCWGVIEVWRAPGNVDVYISEGDEMGRMAHAYPGRALDRFGIRQTDALFREIYYCGQDLDAAAPEQKELTVSPVIRAPAARP